MVIDMISELITDIVEKEQEKRKCERLKNNLEWILRDLESDHTVRNEEILRKYVDAYDELNKTKPLFTYYKWLGREATVIYKLCKDLLKKPSKKKTVYVECTGIGSENYYPEFPTPKPIPIKKKRGRPKGKKNKR